MASRSGWARRVERGRTGQDRQAAIPTPRTGSVVPAAAPIDESGVLVATDAGAVDLHLAGCPSACAAAGLGAGRSRRAAAAAVAAWLAGAIPTAESPRSMSS